MKKRRIMVPIILLALACPVIPGFDSGLRCGAIRWNLTPCRRRSVLRLYQTCIPADTEKISGN